MRISAALDRAVQFDRRRYMRHTVQVGGGLSANIRPSLSVLVTDLSAGGCGIEHDIELEPGARVWLRLPGLENLPARVAWTADRKAGLSFDNPLHPAVVEHVVRGAA
ncbi:MAG TPA: PilZ domain-containing protein [Allosphingosinicella sp.]|nr:PilZ domain-containing protein [Allosphingosinicella sp.]